MGVAFFYIEGARSLQRVVARPKRRKTVRRKAARGRPARKKTSVKRVTVRKVQEFDEEELVKDTLLELTGVHFEVVEPHPAFPLPMESLEWFMRCRNKDETSMAPYVNAAWKEKEGRIWLESLAVGDTIDWIELAYGEERATQSLDLDYSRFADKSFQGEFERRFPIVMGRIREYENLVEGVSKRDRVRLEVRRAGSKGMLVFTIASRIDRPKGAGPASLRSALERNVSALREAYDAIGKL